LNKRQVQQVSRLLDKINQAPIPDIDSMDK
jgi:hypothetical protein